jgi:Zn finger protein HypA/HybF involved in hydrogenase expression
MHVCPIEIAAFLSAIPFLRFFLAKLRPVTKCRYTDCKEQHPVADEEETVSCPTCRKDLGLPV